MIRAILSSTCMWNIFLLMIMIDVSFQKQVVVGGISWAIIFR